VVQQYDGKVEIIGVASRDQRPAMQEFVARHGLEDMVNIADIDGEVWQQYGVVAQPAWVFLDAGRGTGERVLGALPRPELEERLDALSG
jgi:peroxiredoxin